VTEVTKERFAVSFAASVSQLESGVILITLQCDASHSHELRLSSAL
jgi:hypothetical protein